MRKFIITFALLFLSLGALAAHDELRFLHYTTNNGMPSNCIRDIFQDSEGFMWFATDEGVVRFDGRRMKTYPLTGGASDVKENNFASAIHELDGTLYVGTDSYLYRLDRRTDRFENLRVDGASPLAIRNISSDKDGNLWLSVVNGGAYKLSFASDTVSLEKYPFPQFSNYQSAIFVDSRNDIWAVSHMGLGMLHKLDKATNAFKPFQLTIGGKPIRSAGLALGEDASGALWLGTWDEGVLTFDPYTGEARRISRNFKEPHIHSLLPVADKMLVGSDAGLDIVDINSGDVSHHGPDELNAQSLTDQFIYPMTCDQEGGIWIGTYYGGVNYLPPRQKTFTSYKPSNYRNSVSGGIISAFAEDQRGNIYIASDDGGLSLFSPATGAFTKIPLRVPTDYADHNLHTLCFDGDNLWIGSYTSGVIVLNTHTNAVRQYRRDPDNPNSLPDDSSYAIYRDASGTLWVASMNWICTYNRPTDSFERLRNLKAQIVDIDCDSHGTMWFSTMGNGLFAYTPSSGRWEHFLNTPEEGSIPHNHVYCVNIDARGNFYVGTSDGLARFDTVTRKFHPVQLPFGKLSVVSITEDQGVLWLGSERGLLRFVPDKGCQQFTAWDGLSSTQFMPNAALKTSSGKIYLGSNAGFSAFNPYQIRPNTYVPPVVFTGLEIANRKIEVGDPHLPVSIDSLKQLVLNPEDNQISISFAALSYANPLRNKFSYILEGFDKEWTEGGPANSASYTNLPPGDYTFRVRGSNDDNMWNEEGAALRIKVRPPWFASTPARILYLLALVALIFLLVKLILRHSDKRHRKELTQLSKDKEIEVFQAKLSFFTMIAHEIRTPVSLIIGPLEKTLNNTADIPASVRNDLNIIDRNAHRLLFLINQLLDFKKVEETGINVKFRSTLLRPLVEAVTERFRPSIEQKNARLEVVCRVDPDFSVDVDPEAVTKLVSNLLNNARKYTRSLVKVEVGTVPDGSRFTIKVTDNGSGISSDDLHNIFKPFYRSTGAENLSTGGTGLGLSIVKGVAESHGGSVDVESEQGSYTSFTVELPVHQSVTFDAEEAEEPVAEPVAEPLPGAVGKKERMLVVDDNEELCTFIANNFSDRREVITAENGEKALEIMNRMDISFIISDWMMPKMDGVQLCKAVRGDKRFSHIPFVLLTAKTDDFSKIEGLNCGADAYVEKPFSVEVLKARISNLSQIRTMLKQKFSQTPLEPIESIASSSTDNLFLAEMTRIIEENFSNPDLDVDFLASKMDVSRSTLYAKIKTLADVSPNEMIRITRLKKAAKLLVSGRYRISEVCYMVGFNNSSYFAKCFQKQFGMKPGEFITSSQASGRPSATPADD